MSEQRTSASDSEVLQMMIAEHNNLQLIRSASISDANGRTNIFLGTVSSVVLALAFIGEVSGLEDRFFTFAMILLPSLLFIGWVTFVRIYQSGLEDMVAARGINRIRHYYTEIAPHMRSYFILSTHDDLQGMFENMRARISTWQTFVSTAGLISVLNSILTAVFVGMLMSALFSASLSVCLIAGGIMFAASIALHLRYHDILLLRVEKELEVLFPTPPEDEN